MSMPPLTDRVNKKAYETTTIGEVTLHNGACILSYNEDNRLTIAVYNAFGPYHNPHLVPSIPDALGDDPDDPAEPSTVPRAKDALVAPNSPRNLFQLVSKSLEEWLIWAEFMGYPWRTYRHCITGSTMTVHYARAKYVVLIGVASRVPPQLLFGPTNASQQAALDALEEQIITEGLANAPFAHNIAQLPEDFLAAEMEEVAQMLAEGYKFDDQGEVIEVPAGRVVDNEREDTDMEEDEGTGDEDSDGGDEVKD
ncbi:hypothetical protein BJ508DRAFT_334222 [Ascobolus immersus RN42]|uniref:Uncharacterized protein n=1 Tax=Ascobolus immersus RN42 TaxID=1160509 RepID=A0A3N4HME6_ASCIM|nr:hypothetical protein BJ508DRAFT_334222 [Ascobolus immersus RN42]